MLRSREYNNVNLSLSRRTLRLKHNERSRRLAAKHRMVATISQAKIIRARDQYTRSSFAAQ